MAKKEYKERIWSKRQIKRQERGLSVVIDIPPKIREKSPIQKLQQKLQDKLAYNREQVQNYCNHKKTKEKDGYIICNSCYIILGKRSPSDHKIINWC